MKEGLFKVGLTHGNEVMLKFPGMIKGLLIPPEMAVDLGVKMMLLGEEGKQEPKKSPSPSKDVATKIGNFTFALIEDGDAPSEIALALLATESTINKLIIQPSVGERMSKITSILAKDLADQGVGSQDIAIGLLGAASEQLAENMSYAEVALFLEKWAKSVKLAGQLMNSSETSKEAKDIVEEILEGFKKDE